MLMLLYRIYQIVVMLPILLVATIVTALLAIIGSALGFGRWWGYYPEILWSRLFCWLAFVRVEVEGCRNLDSRQGFIFAANHQSAYDIFAIYGYLGHNFRWMMKQSLRRIPFVGFACAATRQVFVDKSSPAALHRTMAEAEARLRSGMSIVVFPEGSRTLTGKMGPFRRGAFTLAAEFGLPVVPITIDGAYDVMPRTAPWPRPGRIRLVIHRPINPPEGGYDQTELMNQTREVIASSLPE